VSFTRYSREVAAIMGSVIIMVRIRLAWGVKFAILKVNKRSERNCREVLCLTECIFRAQSGGEPQLVIRY
jgi:hypothetical protein